LNLICSKLILQCFHFGPSLRRKVLTFFYVNREARVYVRQLAAALDADSTNLSRELTRLAHEGFLSTARDGRQLYYSVNHAYPYLKPVFALLQGSVGIEPTLKKALQLVNGIESAWIFGSFAKGEADANSDIDLLILGRPDQARLSREIRKTEKAFVHGGVLSTVLDEAMSKAIIAQGMEAFTVELRVRFKQKLRTGETVQIRGWVVERHKRRITAEASLCSSAGGEHAHAWGVFLLPPRSSAATAVPLDMPLE
jgi:acyl-coenzyme A thioesterase PaaI-like protein